MKNIEVYFPIIKKSKNVKFILDKDIPEELNNLLTKEDSTIGVFPESIVNKTQLELEMEFQEMKEDIQNFSLWSDAVKWEGDFSFHHLLNLGMVIMERNSPADNNEEINYNLEGENLFTELAKVEPFDVENLQIFSQNFSFPLIKIGFSYHKNIYFLYQFYQALCNYRFAFQCWIAKKENNMELLDELLAEYPNGSDDVVYGILDVIRTHSKIELKPDVEGKRLVNKLKVESLFDIAYFQLLQAVVNDVEIRRCKFCGQPFEVTHGKQKFCAHLPGKRRSACENTYNQRQKRKRAKEREQKGGANL